VSKNIGLLGIFLTALTPIFSQTPAAATATTSTSARVTPVNQRRVDPASMYHRVYAVVPMIGTGTKADPFRPMLVPQSAPATGTRTGILAYQIQMSDDGKSALVEFVGATRNDLLPIISSTEAGVVLFERGNATQAQIETEFQKYKKNFTMSMFNTRAQ
jgi:hypothetical protein